jgi:hypothetical protein
MIKHIPTLLVIMAITIIPTALASFYAPKEFLLPIGMVMGMITTLIATNTNNINSLKLILGIIALFFVAILTAAFGANGLLIFCSVIGITTLWLMCFI